MKKTNRFITVSMLLIGLSSSLGAYAQGNGLDNVQKTNSYKHCAEQNKFSGSVPDDNSSTNANSVYKMYHQGEITADGQWRNDN